MPAVTSIVLGGAALAGAAGSVAGGLINKGASEDATNAALQGSREGIAAQERMAEKAAALIAEQNAQARTDLTPFRESQLKAMGGLEGFADENNPIYQAQRSKATQAIQQQLAAQGLLRSKKQGDLLTDLELGLSQQRLGVLSGLAGTGAGQAYAGLAADKGAQLAGIYGNLGNQLGSSFSQQGQLRGQNALAQGQATAGMIQGIGNAANSLAGSLLNNKQAEAQLAQQATQNLWMQKLLEQQAWNKPAGSANTAGQSLYPYKDIA